MKRIILFFSLFSGCLCNQAFAQGYLMLAGGGSESQGGWSDLPYKWVVDHAANKKIAIISVNDETDWLPNYFKSLGAKWAKNFKIDSKSLANSQWLYDTLVTYNAIYIKGGDQSKYYDYYKGTKTQQAIQYAFNGGGVLAGTSAGAMILSPIVFTAQVASVDPATALMNAYTPQITLANDFVSTLQGNFIFDTHVAERGRLGRIPAFMASWYKNAGQIAIGIGIDDHTAICISPDGNGIVYGTGAVGIYTSLDQNAPFDTQVSMLKSGKIKLTQLLHGTSVNLNTFEAQGYTNQINPAIPELNHKLNIFFSGTDYPSEDACAHFVSQAGANTDPIVVVTGNDLSRANTLKSTFITKGATNVEIIQALPGNSNNTQYQQILNNARKLVLVSNDFATFTNFINSGGNGTLLRNRLKESGMISFFVGDNARFAGATVITNYTTSGGSYRGELQFSSGLAVLENTCIVPYAFINSQYYENTVTGLPFAMIRDQLKNGILITGSTFAEYGYTSSGKSYFKNIMGSYPLIYFSSSGTKGGLANQGPYSTSRNIAGFEQMFLRFLGNSDTVVLGNNVPTSAQNVNAGFDINIFPNPASELINVQGENHPYTLQLLDLSGRVIVNKKFTGNTILELGNITSGYYLIRVTDTKLKKQFISKVLVAKQ